MRTIIAWLVLFALSQGADAAPHVVTVLIFEVDRAAARRDIEIDQPALVKAVEHRVNEAFGRVAFNLFDRPDKAVPAPGGKDATVRLQDDGRIRIEVVDAEDSMVRKIKEILATVGTLEFRITANSHDHAHLISQAKESKLQQVTDSTQNPPKVIGRWVEVEANETPAIRGNPNAVTRDGPKGQLELLVVLDDLNLSGQDLLSAVAMVDATGRPCVRLAFNRAGSQKLLQITIANLPDPILDIKRQFSVIFNDKLMMAPNINTAIADRVEITGNFTEEQTRSIAATLAAGTMPAPLKLVSETKRLDE